MSNSSELKSVSDSIADFDLDTIMLSIAKHVPGHGSPFDSEEYLSVLAKSLGLANALGRSPLFVVSVINDVLENQQLTALQRYELQICGYDEVIRDSLVPLVQPASSSLDRVPPTDAQGNDERTEYIWDVPETMPENGFSELLTALSCPFEAASDMRQAEHRLSLVINAFQGANNKSWFFKAQEIIENYCGHLIANLDLFWSLDDAERRLNCFTKLVASFATWDDKHGLFFDGRDSIVNFSKKFPYRNAVLLTRHLELVSKDGFRSGIAFIKNSGHNLLVNAMTNNSRRSYAALQQSVLDRRTVVGAPEDFRDMSELRRIEFLIVSGAPQIGNVLLEKTALSSRYPLEGWSNSVRELLDVIAVPELQSSSSRPVATEIPTSFSELNDLFETAVPLDQTQVCLNLISALPKIVPDTLLRESTHIYSLESKLKDAWENEAELQLHTFIKWTLLIECGRMFDQRLTVRCIRFLRSAFRVGANSSSHAFDSRLAALEVEALYTLGRDREVCERVKEFITENRGLSNEKSEPYSTLVSYLLFSIINMDSENELDKFIPVEKLKALVSCDSVSSTQRQRLCFAAAKIFAHRGELVLAKTCAKMLRDSAADSSNIGEHNRHVRLVSSLLNELAE